MTRIQILEITRCHLAFQKLWERYHDIMIDMFTLHFYYVVLYCQVYRKKIKKTRFSSTCLPKVDDDGDDKLSLWNGRRTKGFKSFFQPSTIVRDLHLQKSRRRCEQDLNLHRAFIEWSCSVILFTGQRITLVKSVKIGEQFFYLWCI